MTIKRTRDPAGLLPDLVTIEADPQTGIFNLKAGTAELEALIEIMDAGTTAVRIAELRKHESLRANATALASRCDAANGKEDMRLLHDIAQAERLALYLDAAPHVKQAKSAQTQRVSAAESAAEERRAVASERKELARKLAAEVSDRKQKQGITAVAIEVKKKAAKRGDPDGEHIAALSDRQVQNLIREKVGNHRR